MLHIQGYFSIKFSMNLIFSAILIISLLLLLFTNPNAVLSSMLAGGDKALELSLRVIVVCAVWMGIFELLEKTGLANNISNALKPLNKKLFGNLPGKSNDYVSLNISANLLGMSGATTPMGIKSIEELSKFKNTDYATAMFFVINATSIQLVPSSILALRTTMGSNAPADIVLPTIISTLVSTIVGVLLVKIFVKKNV